MWLSLASSESWGLSCQCGARRMAKIAPRLRSSTVFFLICRSIHLKKARGFSWQVGWNVLHYTRDSLQNCSNMGVISWVAIVWTSNSIHTVFIFASPSNSEQSFTCHLCPRNLTVIVFAASFGTTITQSTHSRYVKSRQPGLPLPLHLEYLSLGCKRPSQVVPHFLPPDVVEMGGSSSCQEESQLNGWMLIPPKTNKNCSREIIRMQGKKCSWQIYEWYMNDLYHFIKPRKFEAKQKLIWYHTILFASRKHATLVTSLLWWPL